MRGNQLGIAPGPDCQFLELRLVAAATCTDQMRNKLDVVTLREFGKHLRQEMGVRIIKLMKILDHMWGIAAFAAGLCLVPASVHTSEVGYGGQLPLHRTIGEPAFRSAERTTVLEGVSPLLMALRDRELIDVLEGRFEIGCLGFRGG